MFCNNCGAELKDGTLICERCGARQSAGGNGGAGNGSNGGGKKSSGGFGGHNLGKILAAVISICVIVGGIFGVNRFNSNKKVDEFTHNIEFAKNNLLVSNENTLRLREVPENQTFSVSGKESFVDLEVLDENKNKVNCKVSKSENDRYIVAPNTKWDNSHIYTLALKGNTYFTDEDMYQFRNVVFSIQREEVSSFKYSEKIKNLEITPDIDVNVNDIVLYKDENGQMVCKQVVGKNDNMNIYDTPDLAEVFEELNLHKTIKPNLQEVLNYNGAKRQILQNIIDSNLFDLFVMKTYAGPEDLSKDFDFIKVSEDDQSGLNYGDSFSEQFVKNLNVSIAGGKEDGDLGKFSAKIEFPKPKKFVNGLAFEATISRKKEISKQEKNVNVTENAVDTEPIKFSKIKSDEQTMTVTCEIDSPTVIPNIDISNWKFDLSYVTNVDITIDFNFAWDIKNEFEKEEEEHDSLRLIHTPINAGIPCVFFFFDISVEPEIKSNGSFGMSWNKYISVANGITLEPWEFKSQRLCYTNYDETDKEMQVYIKGSVDGELPVKISLGVKICLIPDEDVNTFATIPFLTWIDDLKKKAKEISDIGKLDLYGKGGLFFELKGELDSEFSLPNNTLEVDLSAGGGVSYDVGIEGELKIKFAEFEAGSKIAVAEGKVYLISFNKKIPIATFSNTTASVAIDVPEVGSSMRFGKYNFIVLEKDTVNGNALIVSSEGIQNIPYNENNGKNKDGLAGSWAVSTLRTYLNEKHINEYSAKEQEAIQKTIVAKDDNKKYGIDGGKPTVDAIFILSKTELERYFKTDIERQLLPSSLAKSSGAYVCENTDSENHRVAGNTVYWVRTPGNQTYNVCCVNSDGSFSDEGANCTIEEYCVRPAMWIHYLNQQVRKGLENARNGIVTNQ